MIEKDFITEYHDEIFNLGNKKCREGRKLFFCSFCNVHGCKYMKEAKEEIADKYDIKIDPIRKCKKCGQDIMYSSIGNDEREICYRCEMIEKGHDVI